MLSLSFGEPTVVRLMAWRSTSRSLSGLLILSGNMAMAKPLSGRQSIW
jgi:hypothetical protein